MSKLLIIIWIVLTGIFLFRFSITKQAVFGDALYYWSYARSLYFDHDINLKNELTHNYSPKTNNSTQEPEGSNVMIPDYLAHHLPIGSGLVWILPMTLADGIVASANTFHIPLVRNGYSDVYQLVVGASNILLVIAGLYLLIKMLATVYPKKIVSLAIILIVFATNLLYYSSIDPINSHPPSFFLSSLFVYLWYTSRENRSFSRWIILGIIVGFLATVRTQDLALLSLPLLETILLLRRKALSLTSAFLSVISYVSGFVIGFLPQLTILYIVFGSIMSRYLASNDAFSFVQTHFLDLMIDPKIGILYYSPIILVAIVGLYLRRKKDTIMASVMLLGLFFQLIVISSYNGWRQGEAYGIRMLISTFPLLLFGLTEVLEYLSKKISFYPVLIICTLSIINNLQAILFFVLLVHNRI